MKNKKKISSDFEKYNMKQYGEFITSYFAWLKPDEQKERAKELNEMTKKHKK